MYNAADRKNVRAAEKAAKREAQERHNLLVATMSSTSGRKWIHDLLFSCHVFRASFSNDPLEMAFREGERNVGLRILDDLMQACPDDYVLMMREENGRRTISEQRGSEDGNGRDQGREPDDSDATESYPDTAA
jgi:hypothetical protein